MWTGQAVSLVGSALVQFALIWWLTETTGSATTVAMATSASLLPTVILGPISGVFVDRWHRKWVLVLSDGFIALLTAALGVLFWVGVAKIWHVYAILFLRSLGDSFQSPAVSATTALMVPDDQLTRIGGMNRTLQGVIRFVAPPMGALLLARVDVRGIMLIDILTAATAILPLLFIQIPRPAAASTLSGLQSVPRDLAQGLRYVWNRRGLRLLFGTGLLWAFFGYPIITFPPLLVTQHFGGGAVELGWLQSALGVGMIAGGVLLTAWGGFKRRMVTSVCGTCGIALSFLVTAAAPPGAFWLAVVAFGFFGLMWAVHSVPIRATFQAVVSPEMQGRFFALNQSTIAAMAPLALTVAGPLADRFGVRPFWFASTVGAFTIALIRVLTPSILYIEDQPDQARRAVTSEPL
jgi:DHA3 family macrolide efflux protein-like MFS transporter